MFIYIMTDMIMTDMIKPDMIATNMIMPDMITAIMIMPRIQKYAVSSSFSDLETPRLSLLDKSSFG